MNNTENKTCQKFFTFRHLILNYFVILLHQQTDHKCSRWSFEKFPSLCRHPVPHINLPTCNGRYLVTFKTQCRSMVSLNKSLFRLHNKQKWFYMSVVLMVETLTLSLDEVSLTDGDDEQHNMVFTSLRNLSPKGRNKSKQIAEEEIFALHFHNQEQPVPVGRTIKFCEKFHVFSSKWCIL